MIILGIDTSGKHGGIALGRAEDDRFTLLGESPIEGGTFSAQLIPQVAGLLAEHMLKKEDIAGFAVASGPGSFTGLRIGLAAVKGLAEILRKPIAAVLGLGGCVVAAGVKYDDARGCSAPVRHRNQGYLGGDMMNPGTATEKDEIHFVRGEV